MRCNSRVTNGGVPRLQISVLVVVERLLKKRSFGVEITRMTDKIIWSLLYRNFCSKTLGLSAHNHEPERSLEAACNSSSFTHLAVASGIEPDLSPPRSCIASRASRQQPYEPSPCPLGRLQYTRNSENKL